MSGAEHTPAREHGEAEDGNPRLPRVRAEDRDHSKVGAEHERCKGGLGPAGRIAGVRQERLNSSTTMMVTRYGMCLGMHATTASLLLDWTQ